MKTHSVTRKAMHLLLALIIALPVLIAGQVQAEATGTQWRDITDNAPSGATSIALDDDEEWRSAIMDVALAPSVWYDITGNLALNAPTLSVDQAVYAAQIGTPAVYFRNPADTEWQSAALSSGNFGMMFSFIARSGKWYAADATSTGIMSPMTINVRISSDQGATWDTYSLPSGYTVSGALNPIVVSSTGAVYLNDGKSIYKLDENRSWSPIPVLPDAGGFSFAYTGVAVNASNELYANIRKYSPLQPLNHSAKLYKYNEGTSQWVEIADSPSASMQLYTDSDSGMHAATGLVMNGETPNAYIYRVDDHGFTAEATLVGLAQARYGIAYGNGYYYTLDADGKTIRTTHPNFSTGQMPPVLSPDLTDNDDVHPLELTFEDNADWRSKILNVTIKKDNATISAIYEFAPGVLRFPQALSAGTYLIEIEADGYKTATVQQQVRITAPVLVADTTNNDTANEITVTFADNTAWRSAVTGVVINGSTADSGTYELSEGKLVFPAGTLPVGNAEIVIQAVGYPDASVTQIVTLPNNRPSGSSSSSGSGGQVQEILKVDVFGGSRTGSVVSQVEIIRTTDNQGRKSDKVGFTSDLAAKAVEALKSAGASQAVIVIPDAKDEVAELQISLPREALNHLTASGIDLRIETRGVSIQIPVASLKASKGDLYFRIVPVKDTAEQQKTAERAKLTGSSAASPNAVIVGRPMSIETNLQSHPVELALPISNFPAGQIDRLRIYIEHGDGTTEWLKGELAEGLSGGNAIRFKVTKFSTFVVLDTGSVESTELPQSYIFGYQDGSFRAEQQVTRGQFAAILSRIYGSTTASSSNPTALYKDEAQFPSWAVADIRRVSALGLMQGYNDGTFRADHAVTRAEAATMIARLAKLDLSGEAAGFTDTRGHWASASIAAAAQAKLVNGYKDGSFAPDRELSRAEAVVLINRLIGHSAQGDQTPRWSDVPRTHWAFGDIQAASSTIAP